MLRQRRVDDLSADIPMRNPTIVARDGDTVYFDQVFSFNRWIRSIVERESA